MTPRITTEQFAIVVISRTAHVVLGNLTEVDACRAARRHVRRFADRLVMVSRQSDGEVTKVFQSKPRPFVAHEILACAN